MERPKFEIVTPKFNRPKGEPGPGLPPQTREEWEALSSLDTRTLRELGLRPWGRAEDQHGNESGPELWLFPAEWYSAIPEGLSVVDIFFHVNIFEPGETDNDRRFGCLSYGILRSES